MRWQRNECKRISGWILLQLTMENFISGSEIVSDFRHQSCCAIRKTKKKGTTRIKEDDKLIICMISVGQNTMRMAFA